MKKLMVWSAFLWGGLLAAAFVFVIYLGINRIVVISDTGSVSKLTKITDSEEMPGHELPLQEGGEGGSLLWIPMESAIGPENITIENRYAERRIVMFIRGATGFFYENNHITGYVEPVQAASYTVESEGVTLYLQLTELYECESILDKGYLQVNLQKPSELYKKVVILDSEVSEELNSQEKEILSQIEEKCRVLLEAEGIRVYSTSEHGKDEGLQNKKMLAEQTEASLYIGLMLGKDTDTGHFGSYVCYSSLYFRPWLTNGDFADQLEREMVTAIEGKALGLVEVEDGILPELSIPAAIICPGYVSNETERALLLTDAYQERIAKGICNGITETFKELE